MEKNKLKVIITGVSESGKTSLALLIGKILALNGIKFTIESKPDIISDRSENKLIVPNLKDKSVSIETKQLSRNVLVDWNIVFGKDRQLSTRQLKERLLSIYSYPERTSERIISKELDGFRVQIGLYKSPLTLI